jgi:hypothetical protein
MTKQTMPVEEKIGVAIMLCLLGVGLLFVRSSGRWKYHEINPIRMLLARRDGTLRPLAKPVVWGLIAIAIGGIWLVVKTR